MWCVTKIHGCRFVFGVKGTAYLQYLAPESVLSYNLYSDALTRFIENVRQRILNCGAIYSSMPLDGFLKRTSFATEKISWRLPHTRRIQMT